MEEGEGKRERKGGGEREGQGEGEKKVCFPALCT
jgi:hypothetical protein